MTIGVMTAMPEEMASLLRLVDGAEAVRIAGREYVRGVLFGAPVVVVFSRLGKVAAAATATILCERFGVEGVVFLGVAGGLAPQVAVGDVVVASEVIQYDLDASPIFPRWEIPLLGRSRLAAPADWRDPLLAAAQELVSRPAPALAEARAVLGLGTPRAHAGLVVTGDRFVSRRADIPGLDGDLADALAVEMEGGAVAQVCTELGLPWGLVRFVSDRADAEAHVDFGRFVASVATIYAEELLAGFFRRYRLGS